MNKIVVIITLMFIFSNVQALENKKKYTIVLDIYDKAHFVHIGNSGFTNQSKYIDLESWDIKSKFKNILKNEILGKLNTKIQITNIKQLDISKETLNFELMFGYDEDKINLIFNKASSLESDYLIVLQSSYNNSISHGTHAAEFDGYGFYSDGRTGNYDNLVNKSIASHFSLGAFIFDLKNKTYRGKKYISQISYIKCDRDLTGTEKDDIYKYVIEEETEKKVMSNYKKLIFKEKINKSKIYDYYKKNNSHLEDDDYEENSWTLLFSLYPPLFTPNDFHLISDIEKKKLEKHFISMLSEVSSEVIKVLP